VHSTKRRHQSPEWTILNDVNCFIQGEVIGCQVLLDSFAHVVRGRTGGLLQLSKGEAVKILASVYNWKIKILLNTLQAEKVYAFQYQSPFV